MYKSSIESYFNSLSYDIEELLISIQIITSLDVSRFNKLKILDCSNNLISQISALPDTLEILLCNNCEIYSICNLPINLKILNCEKNFLQYIPQLPNTLEEFNCSNNILQYLPHLPKNLKKLICKNNLLQNLPLLPSSLYHLDCENNDIEEIINIPINVKKLNCKNNLLLFDDIITYRIYICKKIYYTIKYGHRLERFFIKNIRNKNINIELLYTPKLKFYKQFANILTLKNMNK
jgi:hypothetical protein